MEPPTYQEVLNSKMVESSQSIQYNTNVQPINNTYAYNYNQNNLYTRLRCKKETYTNFTSVQSYNQIPSLQKRDIQLYGRELGVNLEKHPRLIKYVISAIIEPVPSNWEERVDTKGNIYFQNNTILETSWTHPCHNYYRDKIFTKKYNKKKCWSIF
tara:strand:- start:1446 stop:1913 length:468 start_codon:yes stop_codon:yes gene_type:complete